MRAIIPMIISLKNRTSRWNTVGRLAFRTQGRSISLFLLTTTLAAILGFPALTITNHKLYLLA
jgi:hypothetical protein